MTKLTTLAVAAILALRTTSLMADLELNVNDRNINLAIDSEATDDSAVDIDIEREDSEVNENDNTNINLAVDSEATDDSAIDIDIEGEDLEINVNGINLAIDSEVTDDSAVDIDIEGEDLEINVNGINLAIDWDRFILRRFA